MTWNPFKKQEDTEVVGVGDTLIEALKDCASKASDDSFLDKQLTHIDVDEIDEDGKEHKQFTIHFK